MNSIAFTDKTIYTTPTNLPDGLIESIIEYIDSKSNDMNDSKIDGSDSVSLNTRSSKNIWINWDEWIGGIISNMMFSANNEYFNYDLKYFDQPIQAAIYSGDRNDFYSWHTDNGTSVTAPRRSDGVLIERKLSCSLLLSDPNEYEGGELEFSLGEWNNSMKPNKGSCVVFPGWLPHRVKPVTSGKRISLVAWMNGPAFK
jgi:PKHD-type hydroxylase